jgi:hypothetical protein
MTTTRTLPAARQVYNVHNQGTVLSWDLVAPKNKMLQELRVDCRISLTGTAAGSVLLHKIFNTIKVVSEQGSVMTVENDAIPMAVVASHAFREDDVFEASPSNTDIVRNPAITAAATNYDGSYRFHAPLPGTKFNVAIDLNAFVAAVTWATAATFDITVSAVWAPLKGQSQYLILGNRVSALTSKKYRGVSKVLIANATEWSTVLSAIKMGSALSAPQIGINEDISNDQLRGLAVDGTGTTRTLPIKDPATAATVYVMTRELDEPGDVSIETSSAQTFSAVVFTSGQPLEDTVRQ